MTRIIAGCSSNTCMNNDSLKLTLRYLPKVQKQKKGTKQYQYLSFTICSNPSTDNSEFVSLILDKVLVGFAIFVYTS